MTGTRLTIIPAFAFLVSVSLCEQVPAATWMPDSSWKAVDMSDLMVKNGSALDLSAMNDAPAGKHGRAVIGTGGFLAFEDDPMQPVKLMGSNCSFPDELISKIKDDNEFKEKARRFAKATRNQGYNVLRLFSDFWFIVDRMEDMKLRPDRLDRLDFVLSALKAEGIYVEHALFSYNLYRSQAALELEKNGTGASNSFKLAIYLGEKKACERFRWAAETLLKHINPYTGLAWKDDPSVIYVEFVNELEFGLMQTEKAPTELRDLLNAKFRFWLETKYQTPEALAAAWGTMEAIPFAQVDAPRNIRFASKGAKTRDYNLFAFELSRSCAAFCEAAVRESGYKGLTSQFDLPYWWMGDCAVRYECSQAATAHNYFCHPSGPAAKGNPWGSKCSQRSSISEAGSYWSSTNSMRFADRPFLVTEYNHAFWNPYQHECGILFGAYSAFQGFDSLQIHDMPVPALMKVDVNNSFSARNSPVARANEFLVACLFRRGDVKRAQRRVELQIPQKRICETNGISEEQIKIGLLTGFSTAFPWMKSPQGVVTPAKPDIVLTATGSSEFKVGDWSMETASSNDAGFSLDSFVRTLKEQGLLPASNISCPAKGIYQNESGEIVMRTGEKLLKVLTPRSEAVTMEDGRREELGCLKIGNTSVPACIAACTIDAMPLKDSRRIVLIYSTDVANTAMKLSGDRETLISLGHLPVLMKTGKLDMKLENANGVKMALYALGFNGARREQLPLEAKDGTLSIHIDTSTLKDGPTPFFELAAE